MPGGVRFHLQHEGGKPLVLRGAKAVNHVPLHRGKLVRVQLVVFGKLFCRLLENGLVGRVPPRGPRRTGGRGRVKVHDILGDSDVRAEMPACCAVSLFDKGPDFFIFEIQQSPAFIHPGIIMQ